MSDNLRDAVQKARGGPTPVHENDPCAKCNHGRLAHLPLAGEYCGVCGEGSEWGWCRYVPEQRADDPRGND